MLHYIILIWNLIVFLLYGADKLFAKLKRRRIPEKVLLTLSALFASVGASLGMLTFNHKTSKPKFRYSIPILFVVHSSIIYYFFKCYR